MKITSASLGLALCLVSSVGSAAPLNIVSVDAAGINCVFNTNCTNLVRHHTNSLSLPGGIGTGFLETTVFRGSAGSDAAGLYAYEYRIDLTGITSTNSNSPPCFTNVVRCSTNRVLMFTNALVCRTNTTRPPGVRICVTNLIPATNVVICLSNTFPGRTVTRCTTNAAGGVTCFTNTFPATNIVLCFTNRLPARTIINCQTNELVGQNEVHCSTNRVGFHSNVVSCVTNRVPCPGSLPCIDELRLNFGAVARLDFNQDGTNRDQVYIISSGGEGTIMPSSVAEEGSHLVFRFANPICAGESSLAIGIVSTRPPQNNPILLGLTSKGSLVVSAPTPRSGRGAILCDFSGLLDALHDLDARDIQAPNAQAREGRRQSLQNNVHDAAAAAEDGNLDAVLESLAQVLRQVDGDGKDWISGRGADALEDELRDLLRCLERAHDNGDNDHDDDDDDDQGGGKDGHGRPGRR